MDGSHRRNKAGTEVTEGGRDQFSQLQMREGLFFLPDQGRQERVFEDID